MSTHDNRMHSPQTKALGHKPYMVLHMCRGEGRSASEYGEVAWKRGDLFVLPMTQPGEAVTHSAGSSSSALYFVRYFPLSPPHTP